MSQVKFDVQPLFAEPYMRADISHVITDDQVQFILNLKMVQNQINLISENLYIFEEPALKGVKKAVQEVLDAFAWEVMGIRQKLYITQSWSLINRPGVGMHGHSHSNSIVSGSLYFTDMPEPVAGMIFDRHRTYQQIEIRPDQGKRNLYNTPANIVIPKKGEVILFSSSLQHTVERNNSPLPRYSIAFNSFVKGKIGDLRDVSELTL
jgi:uncharacterized protein (TIGR02466 family)